WGIFEETGGLFEFSASEKTFVRNTTIPSVQVRSLAYDPVLEYLYIGTLDQGMFQLALKPQVIFHSSDHQKTIAIDHFGNVPIRLFNDALQIGSQKYNLGFFKREEVKFVSQNKNRLPKHEDFFYELNYDTPVA